MARPELETREKQNFQNGDAIDVMAKEIAADRRLKIFSTAELNMSNWTEV